MCHDKIKFLNYFSTNTIIGKSAAADDKVNDRPYPFNQAGYFPGLDVNTQYTQIQQTLTVASIVGSDALAAQVIIFQIFYQNNESLRHFSINPTI